MASTSKVERIEKFLGSIHKRGCLLVAVTNSDTQLNEWSVSGVESDSLFNLATEIDEFCSDDVNGCGSRSSYQLVGYRSEDDRTPVAKSPRYPYTPDDAFSDTPQNYEAFNKHLMAHVVQLHRIQATTAPQLLEAQARMGKSLLEYTIDSEKNRLEAAKLIEKARSKEHKREMKKIEKLANEEHKAKAIEMALPHIPRVLGGVTKFMLGQGSIKDVTDAVGEEVNEDVSKLNGFRDAIFQLTQAERLAVEKMLPGLLDKASSILASDLTTDDKGNALMTLMLAPWNGRDILKSLKEALGEERYSKFANMIGV